MSHDFDTLIYPCYVLLARDYPDHTYTWKPEVALIGAAFRCMPDIQILDQYSKVHCVAEIGYTDAAKMLQYHQMGIPDIRWYTKKLELVYWNGGRPSTPSLTCRR